MGFRNISSTFSNIDELNKVALRPGSQHYCICLGYARNVVLVRYIKLPPLWVGTCYRLKQVPM